MHPAWAPQVLCCVKQRGQERKEITGINPFPKAWKSREERHYKVQKYLIIVT